MASIGVDFGNETCVIGLAGRGGIDIILNESSNRRTPTMVSFQGKQRFMGEGALSIARSNFKNTAKEIKRLIGRKWEDPELQHDLKFLPFKTEKHAQTGGVGIRVTYNDESTVFSVEQIIAMMLTKVAETAKVANNGIAAVEVVIGIPGWYTDSMRQAMLDSCHIARLNCLRLMHESTAAALAYGIYRSAKGQFSDGVARNILFIDMGHSSFCASVVTFTQAALAVRSTCYDRCLGGRDMDYAIAQYIADDFQKKTKLDPMSNPKSVIKLLLAAEKAKKNLSPIGVTDTVINIECLQDDIDYNGRLSLETFEKLIRPIVEKIKTPVLSAISEGKVDISQLDAIEIVGGVTRVPLVKKYLATLLNTDMNALNFGLSCTLNADEAVARGCALQCAMLSARFRVKEFSVVESVPYAIRVCWKSDETAEERKSEDDSVIMFQRNDESPKLRRVAVKKNTSFSVSAQYVSSDHLPSGTSLNISSYQIIVPESYKKILSPPNIRLNFRHDINGIISLQSAQLMEEIDEVPTAPDAITNNDISDSMDVDKAKQNKEPELPTATSEPGKRKFRKVDLQFRVEKCEWQNIDRKSALEAEDEMSNRDRLVRETSQKRNELEAYIYSTRDRIAAGGDMAAFTSPSELAKLSEELTAAEDWLYSDDGFDSTLLVYSSKLQDMQVISTPIETRLFEATHRDGAIAELRQTADKFRNFANTRTDETLHINDEDRNIIHRKVSEVEEWIFEMQNNQSSIPLHQNPILKVGDVKQKCDELLKVCQPIMLKPKPAPPKKEEKEEEKAKECHDEMEVSENTTEETATPMEEEKTPQPNTPTPMEGEK